MIFVTVGSQLPFDRLIQTVDNWAANHKELEIFAQIGNSDYKPKYIKFCQTMTPDVYEDYMEKSNLIIAHAGMGTIISALELGKKLILMPRLACHGEHRNDHQLATMKHFVRFSNITVTNNETELIDILKELPEEIPIHKKLDLSVSANLINEIKSFIKD